MIFGQNLMFLYTPYENNNMYYGAIVLCMVMGLIKGLIELHESSGYSCSSKNLWDFLFPN